MRPPRPARVSQETQTACRAVYRCARHRVSCLLLVSTGLSRDHGTPAGCRDPVARREGRTQGELPLSNWSLLASAPLLSCRIGELYCSAASHARSLPDLLYLRQRKSGNGESFSPRGSGTVATPDGALPILLPPAASSAAAGALEPCTAACPL